MRRTAVFAFAVLLLVLEPGIVRADIRVIKKPAPSVGPDEYVVYVDWWVSAALRDDTEPTILGSRFNTLAEAREFAERRLAANRKSSKRDSWTWIKFMVIEGEPSVRRKNGPTLPTFQQLVVDTIGEISPSFQATKDVFAGAENLTRKRDLFAHGLAKGLEPTGGLGEYAQGVERAYENAKFLKEKMLGLTEQLTKDQFKAVNDAVRNYNNLLKNPPPGVNDKFVAKMPRMTLVTEDTVKAAEKYREAAKVEAELLNTREGLDAEYARLQQERKDLANEEKAVNSLAAQVVSLRRQSGSDYLAGSSLNGWLAVPSNTLRLTFRPNGVVTGISDEDRRSFTGSYQLRGNQLTMRLGPSTMVGVIQGNTITGSRSRTDGRRDTWSFTFQGERPNLDALQNELAALEGELNARRQRLETRRTQYKADRARYDAAIARLEQRNRKQRTTVAQLQKYTQPRPPLKLDRRDGSRPIRKTK